MFHLHLTRPLKDFLPLNVLRTQVVCPGTLALWDPASCFSFQEPDASLRVAQLCVSCVWLSWVFVVALQQVGS